MAIRNIDFGSHNWHKERCIECGKVFEQWDDLHHECCSICRIARSLEVLCHNLVVKDR
jgi:rRNA maturation endonuclease Nob1